MNKKGIFITIEGIDGTGKSTQALLLEKYLYLNKCDVVITREPGGNKVSESIRKLILDPATTVSPLAELFLYEAARAEHFKEVIFPALESGKIVLSERSIDSTIAYQGYARGLDINIIKSLNKIVTQNVEPDFTILLDIDPDISYQRVEEKEFGTKDRIEKEGIAFQQKVRQGYLSLAKEEKQRIFLVNIENKTIEQVHEIIKKGVDAKINCNK